MEYVIIVSIVICAALIGGFIVPYLVNRKIARFQDELVDRHYAEVESMYRKVRGWRHDYHNHIQTLKAYMELKQYEEADRYLDMLEEDLTTVDTVIKTGNIMADAILNSKLTLMKEKKIPVDVTAVLPEELPVSGVDLSVLVGNLLDNAMEAQEKLPENERFVRIYADVIKRQLYIAVTNAMAGRAVKKGNFVMSTKENAGHGFGILRIDSIAAKYHGYVNRQSEEGVFATEVMLPLL